MRTLMASPQALKNSYSSSSVADQGRFLMKMVAEPWAALTSASLAALAFLGAGAACKQNQARLEIKGLQRLSASDRPDVEPRSCLM